MQSAPDNITTDLLTLFPGTGISVAVLRLDRFDPVVSGNKWFKLNYYIEEAHRLQKKRIVTFGGAWSNHIVATAAVAKREGFVSTGIIRGERPAVLSATLEQAISFGMDLQFISREEYREKQIPGLTGDEYLIPEGGYGEKGALGASTILECTNYDFTHCCCAVGTGTMIAGLIHACNNSQEVIGISVLKNNLSLEPNVHSLLTNKDNRWKILTQYHFGGYAKHTPALLRFMNDFYQTTGIPTDFVYTAKLFYAISELISNRYFPGGSRVLVVHSGGLQGNRSIEKGKLMF